MINWDNYLRRRHMTLAQFLKQKGLKTIDEVREQMVNIKINPPPDPIISEALSQNTAQRPEPVVDSPGTVTDVNPLGAVVDSPKDSDDSSGNSPKKSKGKGETNNNVKTKK